MGKIKIKASQQAMEEAAENGDFSDAPVGWYVARLKSCEMVQSKKSGANQLECIYQIVGVGKANRKPEELYGQLWDYVQLESEQTEWKRAEFCLAHGIERRGKAKEMEFENEEGKPGTIIGNLVLIRVKADNDQEGNYRPRIGKVLPFDEEAAKAADEDEEAAEEAEDPWTKKSLLALDEKDFKAVAKEFGVKLKGLSKKDGIKAILKAQDEVEPF